MTSHAFWEECGRSSSLNRTSALPPLASVAAPGQWLPPPPHPGQPCRPPCLHRRPQPAATLLPVAPPIGRPHRLPLTLTEGDLEHLAPFANSGYLLPLARQCLCHLARCPSIHHRCRSGCLLRSHLSLQRSSGIEVLNGGRRRRGGSRSRAFERCVA